MSSKLPATGTSIFTIMSQMAAEYNAINLSQGFPDFNCDDRLIKLVSYYINKGFNQYAPSPGILPLREAVSDKIKKLYDHKYNPQHEIVITAGATQAVFTAISAAVQKDDEVILIEPAYDSYAPSVKVNKGKPVFIPLRDYDFSINWELVEKSITSKTRMIIINSPHNPTGSVINIADIKKLEDIVHGSNIIILSDEVYEHIVFDGTKHISISSSEELAKRSFVISSFGKTYHTTGWKMGYCAGPKQLMDEFKKFHQFIVFAVNTPVQHAYADFMKEEELYLGLSKFYQLKRDYILELLIGSKFKIKPAKGTYFQILDYSEISDLNDIEFTSHLTKDIGVAAIPLSPFYSGKKSDQLIRICFAKKEDVLKQAAEKLCSI